MPFKLCLILIGLLLLALPVRAQEDLPLSEPISYDDEVYDTLTARAFWDWWHIQAEAGDQIVVEMQAGDQLEPLLGILSSDGTLLARSADGAPGGLIALEYTVETPGEYTIVATRVGNENGTSTGPYDMRVRRANAVPVRDNPYQEVIFRCQDFEAANAATVEFSDDPEQAIYYVISIYGFGDFQPVIRATFESLNFTDCARDSQGMGGNIYQLPGEEAITLTENFADHAAQLFIPAAAEAGTVTLTIGSVDGRPGRYIAVIDRFIIGEDDLDSIRVGPGPLAAAAPLTVYMVADSQSRLDPSIEPIDEQSALIFCDDAGRRCDAVESPDGLYIHIDELNVDIRADRFDAAALIAPGRPEIYGLELSSVGGRTTGRYSIILVGELPARE